jgi:hypothetical protein
VLLLVVAAGGWYLFFRSTPARTALEYAEAVRRGDEATARGLLSSDSVTQLATVEARLGPLLRAPQKLDEWGLDLGKLEPALDGSLWDMAVPDLEYDYPAPQVERVTPSEGYTLVTLVWPAEAALAPRGQPLRHDARVVREGLNWRMDLTPKLDTIEQVLDQISSTLELLL